MTISNISIRDALENYAAGNCHCFICRLFSWLIKWLQKKCSLLFPRTQCVILELLLLSIQQSKTWGLYIYCQKWQRKAAILDFRGAGMSRCLPFSFRIRLWHGKMIWAINCLSINSCSWIVNQTYPVVTIKAFNWWNGGRGFYCETAWENAVYL